jgi:DHA1 family bicyclomycin/chloramphenicol resistance-like MFS transporter
VKLTPWLVVILGALASLGPFGSDSYLVALPVMAGDLVVSGSTIQLTLMAYTVGMALGQLGIGAISDRIGRRRILMGGAALMVVAATTAALTSSASALIISCLVMGTASASGLVSGRAVVSDLTTGPSATRAFSFLGLVTGLGPMVGPLVGALLMGVTGWRGIFGFIAIYAAAMVVLVALFVGESLPPERRLREGFLATMANYPDLFRDPMFRWHALAFWSLFGVVFGYLSSLSFILQGVLGLPSGYFTLTFALTTTGGFLTGILTTYLAKWVPARALAAIGLTALSLGAVSVLTLILTGVTDFLMYLPAFILMAGMLGFIFGPINALALTHQRHRGGTAFSLLGFFQWVSAFIASGIITAFGVATAIPFGFVEAGFAALAVLFFALGAPAARAHRAGRV